MKFWRRTMFNVLCYGLFALLVMILTTIATMRQALTDPSPETMGIVYERTLAAEENERQKIEADLITIDTDSGAILEEVVMNLSQQDYESVATFDSNGAKIADVTSNYECKVRLTSSWWEYFREHDGLIVVHNHPKNHSFSAQDLYAAALCRVPLMLVVTEQYVFIMKVTASIDIGDDPANQAQAMMKYCDSRRTWWSEHATLDECPKDMSLETYVTHQAMVDTAREFGFAYYYTKLTDFRDNLLFSSKPGLLERRPPGDVAFLLLNEL